MSLVCARVSVTVRLSRRVSFSGCILLRVVVTISPVGPSISSRRGRTPFGVLSAVKAALDPNGILNPGKLGLPSPFGSVRWPA